MDNFPLAKKKAGKAERSKLYLALLDLAAVVNCVTFQKNRCFYPTAVPRSVVRLGVNLEKIKKQAGKPGSGNYQSFPSH